MKVAIIGSRNIDKKVAYKILSLIPENTTEIISGGADGVDKIAELIAENLSIKTTIFYPEYEKYGRAAPLRRNTQIISSADYVLAFWDGQSQGTKRTIKECLEIGKAIKVIKI